MVFCLDSKDYMQIRNALIILIRILPYFPILSKLAQIIEKRVEKVINEERNQRQDLFTLATSYIGQLKNKSNDMIREADFHQVSDKPSKTPTENAKVTNGTANNTPIVIIGKYLLYTFMYIRKIITNNTRTIKFYVIDDRGEKKASTSSSSSASTKNSNSSSNGADKEPRVKESEKSSSKESKRDKEDSETRKRERNEKRRERKTISPPPHYEPTSQERYYSNNDIDRDRERDRDLSSISNSSNGSTNRRSQESPDHDRGNIKINKLWKRF